MQKAEKSLCLVALACFADLAKHNGAFLAANGGGDATFPRWDALHPRHVFLFDPALLHRTGQQRAAVRVFGDSQDPSRLSV